jgi:hypothetical protein
MKPQPKIKDCIWCWADSPVFLPKLKCRAHQKCFYHKHFVNQKFKKYHIQNRPENIVILKTNQICFFCKKYRRNTKTVCWCIVKSED